MVSDSTILEFQKSQQVRVLDMIFVAPLLIYSGATPSWLHPFIRVALVITGAATFLYNANNYFLNLQVQQ